MKQSSTILFLLGFLAISCGKGMNSHNSIELVDSSIIGGGDTVGTEYDAVLELLTVKNEDSFICSATAIGKNLILTAGHCVDSPDFLEGHVFTLHYTRGGKKMVLNFLGTALIRHPLDRSEENILDYDTAIVQTDVDLSQYAKVIPLATKEELTKIIQTATTGVLVGFGVRDDGQAGDRRMKVETAYSATWANFLFFDDGTKNARFGDSGGPAVMLNEQGEKRVVGNLSFIGAKKGFSGYVRADVAQGLISLSKTTSGILKNLKSTFNQATQIDNLLNTKCPNEVANTSKMITSSDEIFFSLQQEVRFYKSNCPGNAGFIKVVLSRDIEKSLIEYFKNPSKVDRIKLNARLTDRAGASGAGVVELIMQNDTISEVLIYDTLTASSQLVNLHLK